MTTCAYVVGQAETNALLRETGARSIRIEDALARIMKQADSAPSQFAPSWSGAFPRLCEIYLASDQASAGNWFQQPNVWQALISNDQGLQPLERDLQVLDSKSWSIFLVKAAQRVHQMDKWGYSRALFDCFNETKGYRFLVENGYEEVRVIPEQQSTQTPDLRARLGPSTVLMEVKTVNESDNQKDYFEIPGEQRPALKAADRLSPSLQNKLASTVGVARTQLLAVKETTVTRRIIYLIIRPDLHFEADDEFRLFLRAQSTPEIEIVHHFLG